MEHKNPFELKQVAIRMVEEPPLKSEYALNSPSAVISFMADTLKEYDREVVAVINLRPDLKPINMNIVSIGALDQSMVHPREAVKSMILSNAASVLLIHNHTTGNMTPSKEDIAVTDRMAKVCDMVGIKLLDHVIVGPSKEYYSFREQQRLPLPEITYAKDLSELHMGEMVAEERWNQATISKHTQEKIVSFTVSECGEFHNLGEFHEDIKTAKDAAQVYKKIPEERMHGIPAIGIRIAEKEETEVYTETDIFSGNCFEFEFLEYLPEISTNEKAGQEIAALMHEFPNAEIRGTIPETVQKSLRELEIKEKQPDQLKLVLGQLEKGVKEVFESSQYKALLNTMAKFPRYSANNSMLIMMQKPEAQLCQSFTGWKKMNRYVKKGEKGIKILAPAPFLIQKEQNKIDEKTGKLILDKDGEPIKETVEMNFNYFKVVNTFDISQTDGEELPSFGTKELIGSVKGYEQFFDALKESCPVPILFENIPSGAKGYYHLEEKRIAIQEGMSEIQSIKTILHEMAHQKLHADTASSNQKSSRNSKEVEAESIAYVVCKHYGIDTSDYSFGYVASWSKGKETPELKQSLELIRNTAADMIEKIEGNLAVLTQERNEKETPIKEEKEQRTAEKESINKKLEHNRGYTRKNKEEKRKGIREGER